MNLPQTGKNMLLLEKDRWIYFFGSKIQIGGRGSTRTTQAARETAYYIAITTVCLLLSYIQSCYVSLLTIFVWGVQK